MYRYTIELDDKKYEKLEELYINSSALKSTIWLLRKNRFSEEIIENYVRLYEKTRKDFSDACVQYVGAQISNSVLSISYSERKVCVYSTEELAIENMKGVIKIENNIGR